MRQAMPPEADDECAAHARQNDRERPAVACRSGWAASPAAKARRLERPARSHDAEKPRIDSVELSA
jgi:hypothetical protein